MLDLGDKCFFAIPPSRKAAWNPCKYRLWATSRKLIGKVSRLRYYVILCNNTKLEVGFRWVWFFVHHTHNYHNWLQLLFFPGQWLVAPLDNWVISSRLATLIGPNYHWKIMAGPTHWYQIHLRWAVWLSCSPHTVQKRTSIFCDYW